MKYLQIALKVPSKVLQLAVATAVLCYMRPTKLVRRNLGVYVQILHNNNRW